VIYYLANGKAVPVEKNCIHLWERELPPMDCSFLSWHFSLCAWTV